MRCRSAVMGFAFSLMLAGAAFAQPSDPQVDKSATDEPERAPPAGLQVASVTGTLQAFGGNQLKIQAEEKEYVAVVTRQTNVSYHGTAEVSFLRPGMLVRFETAFDQQGVPQAAVTEIEIFRAVQRRRMSRQEMQRQTPGFYPATPEKGTRGGKPEAQRGGKRQPQAATGPGTQSYLIVGQLRGLQADRIQVLAGRRPFIVQLDPAVVVRVATADTTFCRPGDEIEVAGLQNAQQPSLIQAESVVITGTQPLGQAAEPQAERGRRGPLDKREQTPERKRQPAEQSSKPKI